MSRVAVVIPCYNHGRTVGDAVESALRQTHAPVEVVIVDDGSTDVYTRQVLSSSRWAGVSIVHTENAGQSAARNHGIRLTTAEYLVTLDADDMLESTYVERTAAVLDRDPSLGFVATQLQAFGDAGYIWTPPPCTLEAAFTRGAAPPAAMFRRTAWEAVSGFDPRRSLQGIDDRDFWISIMERGYGGHIIEEPLLRYRVAADGMHQRNVASGLHLRQIETLFEKHRPTIERLGPSLLVAKEAFFLAQREHNGFLKGRTTELEGRLQHIEADIAGLRHALASRGVPPVDFGELRRVIPFSPVWGVDRGKPLDRYYIEAFLDKHRSDIRGAVLEVKDSGYTDRYGGAGVEERGVLDLDASNPRATIVADLTRHEQIPEDRFDCFILTQTLHIIYDIRTALEGARRLLKPGGVLLCTLPCVSRINYEDGGLDSGDYWRFTEASARRLFAEFFPLDSFEVTVYGNVLACAAFLYGLSPDELGTPDLEHCDPWFPLLIGVRAVKPRRPGNAVRARGGKSSSTTGAILMYHRIGSVESDVHGLAVTPEDFRAQMTHLRDNARPISLEELADGVQCGSLPDRAVAVTFDDGGLDGLLIASPVLSELGIPSTFFVTTDRLNEPHEFWWDTLERILLGEHVLPPTLRVVVAGRRSDLPAATPGDRIATHHALHAHLLNASSRERDATVAELSCWSGIELTPRASHRPMTGDELQVLASMPGHEIGGHTTHHLWLPRLSLDEQRSEIARNKKDLEDLLQRRVQAFAYPFGAHDQQTVRLVLDAGFTVGAGVRIGARSARAVSLGMSPLLLPRIDPGPRCDMPFEALLNHLYDPAAPVPSG